MPGSAVAPRAPRSRSPRALLPGLLLALAGLAGCGEDVLVARFGLTSNTSADAGVDVPDEGGSDAGLVKGQSSAAQRARARARARENAASHSQPEPPPTEDDKKH